MSNDRLDDMSQERAWMIYQILLAKQEIPDSGFTLIEAVQAIAKVLENGTDGNVRQSYLN